MSSADIGRVIERTAPFGFTCVVVCEATITSLSSYTVGQRHAVQICGLSD